MTEEGHRLGYILLTGLGKTPRAGPAVINVRVLPLDQAQDKLLTDTDIAVNQGPAQLSWQETGLGSLHTIKRSWWQPPKEGQGAVDCWCLRDSLAPRGHTRIWLPCPLASTNALYPISKTCTPGMTGLPYCRVHNSSPTCCQNVSGRVTVILFHGDMAHGAIVGDSDVSCQCLPLRNDV